MNPDFMVIYVIISIVVFFFVILFYFSRYRKFNTNVYVIHLRGGKIKAAGLGGRCFVIPFSDEIVLIPAQVQATDVEIPSVFSANQNETSLSAVVMWQVIKPDVANTMLSWVRTEPNFANRVMNELVTGSFIDAALKIETDWRGTAWMPEYKKMVLDDLHGKIMDYGIALEAIEIHMPKQERANAENKGEDSLLEQSPGE